MSKKLSEYNRKRDFKKTNEPGGVVRKDSTPRFSIQKHDASNLHYDFRLEYAGVLKSWAIPKGPSTDPSEKRLAVQTEDHPVDYIDFEGTIPEGEYGAGKVIVWDEGTYENITEKDGKLRSIEDSLKEGHLLIRLNGKKIRGGFALNRMSDDKWLLVKMKDEDADARRNPVSTEPKSVKSGKSIEDLEE